jgi:hypothetical protein
LQEYECFLLQPYSGAPASCSLEPAAGTSDSQTYRRHD